KRQIVALARHPELDRPDGGPASDGGLSVRAASTSLRAAGSQSRTLSRARRVMSGGSVMPGVPPSPRRRRGDPAAWAGEAGADPPGRSPFELAENRDAGAGEDGLQGLDGHGSAARLELPRLHSRTEAPMMRCHSRASAEGGVIG